MARRDIEPDMRVVDALCRGAEPPRRANYVERLAAIRHLAESRFSDRQIAALIRITPRSVIRIRSEHGIKGLPRGTNGMTRPRVWPLEPRNRKK